ncbi:MAG: hypothetical protein K2Y16_05510 [Burkholderiales bacterium]|nr:hypothetical protein [Burkholderiales bacterium]
MAEQFFDFVGDFVDRVNLFKTGETIEPKSFKERCTLGLIDWWNAELKDRTPKWTRPPRLPRLARCRGSTG